MAEPHTSLDDRLTAVERALADLDRRVEAVERGHAASPARIAPPAEPGLLALPRVDVAGTSALAGRAFVVVAGAYLLRALTESGLLHRATGATLGLLYAMALAAAAYRVAPRDRGTASSLGGCSVLIGFSLVWEITTRFVLLTPEMSALTMSGIAAAILFVAWRRDLHVVAWLATVGACALAVTLLVATRAPMPFAVFLIALGIATLWLGYDREWIGLRWIAALAADFSVVALITRALAEPPLDPPARVMGVLIVLLVGYLGSVAIRTLVRRRNVLPFEAAQTAASLVIGVLGAVVIARRTGAGAFILGPTLLLLAVASYTVAFIHRQMLARAANYYFYTTLGLVLALTAGDYVFERLPAGMLWTPLAIAMGWLARRFGRITLHSHAIVYLLVGAWTTGLLSSVESALFGPPTASIGLGVNAWLIAGAVPACWWMTVTAASQRHAGVPRTMLTLMLVVVAAGVCVIGMREALLPHVEEARRAAILATTRTAVIGAGAVLAAWLGTRPMTREFGRLLYPILGWGLVKLVFEDFRVSPPSLLFVALALYGAALIVAPRLAKRSTPGVTTPQSSAAA
jgi:hypothetical protein